MTTFGQASEVDIDKVVNCEFLLEKHGMRDICIIYIFNDQTLSMNYEVGLLGTREIIYIICTITRDVDDVKEYTFYIYDTENQI